MGRRKDHTRAELKDMIIKCSIQIIEREGLSALTARRIAKEIGYVAGTIYNIFQSMDMLVLEINMRTMDKLWNVLQDNDDTKTMQERCLAMAERYYEFAQNNRPLWLSLFQHQWPQDLEYPEWYEQKIANMYQPLEQLLFYFSPSVRKQKMASRVLWASIHGLIYMEATRHIPKIERKTPAVLELATFLIEEFFKKTKS